MTRNLLTLLLAAVLGVLAGCGTAPRAPANGPMTRAATGAGESADSPPAAAPWDGPEASVNGPNPPASADLKELERGQASWYGPRFHGRRTASGERYDQYALTAAHKSLPFGTLVRVRSLVTGKEVDVRVNDRGPFVRGRVIDVSRAAAEALGMMALGVKPVALMVVEAAPSATGRSSQPALQARRSARPAAPAVSLSSSDTYPSQ
jgi:rare lipoprotein A